MIAALKKLFRPTMEAESKDTPSILRQTGFRVGFFNFGQAEKPGVDYFNCALAQRDDGLWLVVRRSRNRARLHFGFNDLVAFLLDPVTLRPIRGVPVQMQKRWPDEQWEDPRVMMVNGRTFISCCDFIWNRTAWTGAHQIIEEVDANWSSIRRFDPTYGFNGDNLGHNTKHEKNWLFFRHDDAWHLIYGAEPHVVAMFDDGFNLVNEWKSDRDLCWDFGEVRGGTPPVFYQGRYWTFFHSSTKWRPPYRQYHMGAYAFNPKPPFDIDLVTIAPLLSGSYDDPHSDTKPIVVFPCGAIIRDKKWLITFGVNDLKCGFMEIPHNDLLERMAAI